jgi:hypothetical protein
VARIYKGTDMTDTQFALLLANIWLARHAGPRYSLAIALLFLSTSIYVWWFK